MSRVQDKISNDIEKFGWSSIAVFPDETSGWTYSIGFWEVFKHPEVVIIGLEPRISHALLGEVYEIAEQGETFEVGQYYDNLLQDYQCTFRPIPEDEKMDLLGQAWGHYDASENFEALQLVWPDRDGLFPWQDGYGLPQELQRVFIPEVP